MTLTLTNVQKLTGLGAKPVDDDGNPAPVEGALIWATSDASIATVEPQAEDGSLVTILTVDGAVGSCEISVTGDADLGAGVETISGSLTVMVVAPTAKGFAFSAGTIEHK